MHFQDKIMQVLPVSILANCPDVCTTLNLHKIGISFRNILSVNHPLITNSSHEGHLGPAGILPHQ